MFTAPQTDVQTWATITATSVEDPNQAAHSKVTVTPPSEPPLTITTSALPIIPVNSTYPVE